tara:strand:+ start:209 stop:463 length:255 start_codon:yes stop_codon:yes gene_type:complete
MRPNPLTPGEKREKRGWEGEGKGKANAKGRQRLERSEKFIELAQRSCLQRRCTPLELCNVPIPTAFKLVGALVDWVGMLEQKKN